MPDRLSKVDRANLQEFADRKRIPITIAEARGLLAMMAQDLIDVDERRTEIEAAADEMARVLGAAHIIDVERVDSLQIEGVVASVPPASEFRAALAAYRAARGER